MEFSGCGFRSHSGQLSMLLWIILRWWIPHIYYIYIYIYIYTCLLTYLLTYLSFFIYIEDVDFHDVNSRTERSKIKFDIYYKLTSVFTYVTLRAQKNNSLHCLWKCGRFNKRGRGRGTLKIAGNCFWHFRSQHWMSTGFKLSLWRCDTFLWRWCC